MEINFSRGDLLAGQPIPPNWYKGSIVKEELRKRDNVLDYIITLDFEDPLLAQDERTVEHVFFNFVKGKGFLIVLMAALLNRNVKEITDGMEKGEKFPFQFGEGQNVGKKVQFELFNDPYEGRLLNKIRTFIPYSMDPPTMPLS